MNLLPEEMDVMEELYFAVPFTALAVGPAAVVSLKDILKGLLNKGMISALTPDAANALQPVLTIDPARLEYYHYVATRAGLLALHT